MKGYENYFFSNCIPISILLVFKVIECVIWSSLIHFANRYDLLSPQLVLKSHCSTELDSLRKKIRILQNFEQKQKKKDRNWRTCRFYEII